MFEVFSKLKYESCIHIDKYALINVIIIIKKHKTFFLYIIFFKNKNKIINCTNK